MWVIDQIKILSTCPMFLLILISFLKERFFTVQHNSYYLPNKINAGLIQEKISDLLTTNHTNSVSFRHFSRGTMPSQKMFKPPSHDKNSNNINRKSSIKKKCNFDVTANESLVMSQYHNLFIKLLSQ